MTNEMKARTAGWVTHAIALALFGLLIAFFSTAAAYPGGDGAERWVEALAEARSVQKVLSYAVVALALSQAAVTSYVLRLLAATIRENTAAMQACKDARSALPRVQGIAAAALVIGLALSAGCATQYSAGHTPLASMAVRRAERMALEDGWHPVRTAGEVRFVRRDHLPALPAFDAPVGDILAREFALRALAEEDGLPVATIIARYGGGLYRAAQFADGALITGAAGVVTWGIAEAANGGGGSSQRTETDQSRNVSVHNTGDGNSIVILTESSMEPTE